ncbi:hypothetical protein [Streptomyces sp. NBC_01217]|uniref:hypothetical protein n=1 Tax=Streptomyces sp. NBC_01217 TaxID=2903779 RepID=UPI002E11259F|nr:hypothetical protein OG507_34735 [Streptomyces sp. NBC_01217]
MTVHQGAWEIREFTQYLRNVVTLLDPGSGWYGVFCRRDPEGMRACLDGAEIPPWDVMESLFQDLAAVRGTAYAQRESVRAAELYSASVTAHDRRPGGRQVLVERLELMLREQTFAAQRLRAAGAGGTTTPDAEELAWARDDHERATARCTELRGRLAAVTVPKGWFRAEDPAQAASRTPAPSPARTPEAESARVPDEGPRTPRPPAAPKRKKPRGARFAGLDIDEADDDGAMAAPVLPVPPTTAAVPRGARFGAAQAGGDAPPDLTAAAPDPEARRAAARAVEMLLRLRAEGRSGEAHVVLCEAAGWPADRLPVLAVELHRAGLDADWVTLLWEVSSLPPAELAAAAGALAAAGRPDDCDHLLRQGVARPAAEIADAVVALDRAGRGPQAQALLGAFIRVRTPQDAARVAAGDPHQLVPYLLAAARAVSPAREWDVVHALRVAGIVAAP